MSALHTLYNILYLHDYGSEEISVHMAKCYLNHIHLRFKNEYSEAYFYKICYNGMPVSITSFESGYKSMFDWQSHALWNNSETVMNGVVEAARGLKENIDNF